MNKPFRITLTGIDESTRPRELFSLLHADPRVELAILYSETRAGSARYPFPDWIDVTVSKVNALFPNRLALHICGRTVKRLIDGTVPSDLPSLWKFGRIQLNGKFSEEESVQLWKFIGEGLAFPVITQYDGNEQLHELIRRPRHQVLFDASGGRGIARKDWPTHLGDWICGYAGGLGPDNLREELPRIAAAAGGREYWIDMESSLRDEADRFCSRGARLALEAIHDAEREMGRAMA